MSGSKDRESVSSQRGSQGSQVRHILAIERGPESEVLPLESGTYSIGRDRRNAIFLEGSSISRQHAILLRVPIDGSGRFEFRLIDGNLKGNRSKNGTYVNGKSILTCKLKAGDKIRFGKDVEAEYLVIPESATSESRGPQHGPTGTGSAGLRGVEGGGRNLEPDEARETLSHRESDSEVDVALARLASFPELIPNPIVEFDLLGTITYANPAALKKFPNLLEKGASHPFLDGISARARERGETCFTKELRFAAEIYEQSIHYFPESDLIRVFAIETTEKERTKLALKAAEDKYRAIFETAIEGIYQISAGGRIRMANPALARILGYDSPEQLMAEIVDVSRQLYVDPNRRHEIEKQIAAHGSASDFRSLVFDRDGRRIWISENARISQFSCEDNILYEGSIVEITERVESERELRERSYLLSVVAKAANLLLADSDVHIVVPQSLFMLGQALGVEHVCIYKNVTHPELPHVELDLRYEWTQRKSDGVDNRQDVLKGLSYEDFQESGWHAKLASGKAICSIVRELPLGERNTLLRRDVRSILLVPIFLEDRLWGLLALFEYGSERQWFEPAISATFALSASISGVLRRKCQEESIRRQALHDSLTNLPSRLLFEEQLERLLPDSKRRKEMLAVLFLDLDNFKFINDTFGHDQGDSLLRGVARRLVAQVRAGDVVSRWGGDEFTILLPKILDISETNRVVERILDTFHHPFVENGREIHATVSIGVATFPQDGRDAATLIKNADVALYQAKEAGKNSCRFYNSQARKGFSGTVSLSKDLQACLTNKQLDVYYQPIINPITRKIVTVEALLRWNHPEFGLMSPARFLPEAEKTGSIVPIGEWVAHTVLERLAEWHARGLSSISVAINFSIQQLLQRNLKRFLEGKIDSFGVSPSSVSLEVTETAAFKEISEVERVFSGLRSTGIELSIDDFGSGYSSFSRLQKLPLRTLKTDRSLVQNIVESERERNIVEAILSLGKNLGLQVVVEGVESQAQLQVLTEMQCENIQGFVYYKPMPAGEMTRLLEAQLNCVETLE